ncbi:WhiB family transcriptional regulator [Streptomyces tendae]|uniref:WhiB family transcriptional regulator n=1 Tax=Streptomyces tendae TaxID=1932 RepID=UPI0036D10A05
MARGRSLLSTTSLKGQTDKAKAHCAGCPVRETCANHAITNDLRDLMRSNRRRTRPALGQARGRRLSMSRAQPLDWMRSHPASFTDVATCMASVAGARGGTTRLGKPGRICPDE